MNDDKIPDETLNKLLEILDELIKKIQEESGKECLIAFGIANGNEDSYGATISGDLKWASAAKLLAGITAFVSHKYGCPDSDCDHLV